MRMQATEWCRRMFRSRRLGALLNLVVFWLDLSRVTLLLLWLAVLDIFEREVAAGVTTLDYFCCYTICWAALLTARSWPLWPVRTMLRLFVIILPPDLVFCSTDVDLWLYIWLCFAIKSTKEVCAPSTLTFKQGMAVVLSSNPTTDTALWLFCFVRDYFLLADLCK